MTAKPLPSDLDAEAACIASMLLNPASIDAVMLQGLTPAHCYADANRYIIESIYELYESESVIDVVTLANRLRDKNRLQSVGGPTYLMQLADATPAVAHVTDHASIVIEKARLRSAIQICQLALVHVYEPIDDTQKFLEELEVNIAEVTHIGRRVGLEPVGKILAEEVSRIAELRRLGLPDTTTTRTGITELDRIIGGLMRGHVYVVGARPGMGKTAFMTTLIANISRPRAGGTRPGSASMLFSLEMPRRHMAARFATHETGLPTDKITGGTVNNEQWPKLVDISAKVHAWPVWIDDSPALGLGELRATVRQFKRRLASGALEEPHDGSIGVVAIDYLQLMRGVRARGSSREEEIASLSRGLKELAKEEDVPIVVAAQLNRNVEKNMKDKRPSLSDLRESGSIEQDADAVLFLYREHYYNKEAEARDSEIIVAKYRNGPTGTVHAIFDGQKMRFYDMAPAATEDFMEEQYWDD